MKRFLCVILLLLLCGCGKTEVPKTTYWLLPVTDADGAMVLLLNSEVKLTVTGKEDSSGMEKQLSELVTRYHRLLDSHHDYEENGERIPNLKAVNDSYGSGEAVAVAPELIEALKESFVLARLSEGYFNPTVGALSDLWSPRFSREEHFDTEPSGKEIAEALACKLEVDELEEYIEIDEANSTVRLRSLERCKDRVVIDLGAFSKGYVLDKARESLMPYGRSFLIDGGSSSVVTYNCEAEKEKEIWTVGIRSPQSGGVLFAFRADSTALSTSGDDERFFLTADPEGNIIRRHHILDPFTGKSENFCRGITLVSDSHAAVLDALSTALFSVSDRSQQNRILEAAEKHYGIKIEKSLLLEEEDRLILETGPSLRGRMLNDMISGELTKILTTAE